MLAQQEFDILLSEFAGCGAVTFPEHGGECALLVLEGEDLFLDRAPGDQPMNEHRFGLANAVGPVDGLPFDRGVPPRIIEDDGVCRREVEPGAPGLQADEDRPV